MRGECSLRHLLPAADEGSGGERTEGKHGGGWLGDGGEAASSDSKSGRAFVGTAEDLEGVRGG